MVLADDAHTSHADRSLPEELHCSAAHYPKAPYPFLQSHPPRPHSTLPLYTSPCEVSEPHCQAGLAVAVAARPQCPSFHQDRTGF